MRKKYYLENHFNILAISSQWTRNYGRDFHFEGERHPSWEMLYVESGTLTVAEDENIYDLQAGQLIIHAPMEFHRFWAKKTTPDTVFKIVAFELDTNINHNLADGIFTLNPELQRQFEVMFYKIKESYDTTEGVKKKENNIPCDEILSQKLLESFLLNIISSTTPEKTVHFSKKYERYKEVVEYMNMHIYEWLSIKDIAKGVCLSTSYIKQMFSEFTGCGVGKYFLRLKLVFAASLLKEGQSVKQVSEKLAFSTPNYFSTSFKREMKISPKEYVLKM